MTHCSSSASPPPFPVAGRSHDLDQPRTAAPRDAEVLWIDDELRADDALVRLLAWEGFRVHLADSGTAGLAKPHSKYDAIILDLHLADMFGLTVLKRLVARGVVAPIVVVTGCYLEPEVEAAAMAAGAAAFKHKPLVADEVAEVLRMVIEPASTYAGRRPAESAGAPPFGIVAGSAAMRPVVEWIRRVGPTRTTALLTGETGTGKDLVARALHQASQRRDRPFVPVNCGAIPQELVDAELFGHRKGAFTGALDDKAGLVEAADEGTLFLDEIADLPLPMQGRLLRFLESGEVRRVGDTRTKGVDVRVIAATNGSLWEEIARGRFREDLYYRLAVAECRIPPLRERLEDLEVLIALWLPQLRLQAGVPVVDISPGALALLRTHAWPGNVRELRNVLERAMFLARGDVLTEQDVAGALCRVRRLPPVAPPDRGIDDRGQVLAALDECHWSRGRAARLLGISRSTLWRRLRRSGLGKPRNGN